MNRDNILEELKLSDNVMAHRPAIRMIDYVLGKKEQEICKNCEHYYPASTSPCDADDNRFPTPDWSCADFERKEEDAIRN